MKHFSFLSFVLTINFVALGGSLSNRQLVPSEGPLSGSATDGTDSELSGSSPSPRPFGPVGTEDPGKSKSEFFWDSVGIVVFFLSFYTIKVLNIN